MSLQQVSQHRRPDAGRRMAGLTMVELMVTVGVAAVLAATAVPSMQSFVRVSQVRTAANELAVALATARSEAVKRGNPVTVCKSADVTLAQPLCTGSTAVPWRQGWIMFVDHDQDGVIDTSGSLPDVRLRVGAADGRLTVQADTNFSRYVSYLPNGVSVGSGGSSAGAFHVCLNGVGRAVTVNTSGRTQVREETCS